MIDNRANLQEVLDRNAWAGNDLQRIAARCKHPFRNMITAPLGRSNQKIIDAIVFLLAKYGNCLARKGMERISDNTFSYQTAGIM